VLIRLGKQLPISAVDNPQSVGCAACYNSCMGSCSGSCSGSCQAANY
jgi:hypothetical protein